MKNVAFFIGEITKEYQTNLTSALVVKALKNDVKLFIFANHGTYGTEMFYSQGEKSIIGIPDLSKFDGIICVTDTLEVEGMGEQLMEKIRMNATCPVVSVRKKEKEHYSVVYDDMGGTYEMTKHFIEKHGFKKIAFMTGTITSQDAKDRLKGYLKAMSEHGLSTPEHYIYYGNYWRNRGNEAIEWFLEEDGKLPEAIVCSNDYMAISVCEALKARNYTIPNDCCVAGFDDLEESRYHFPPLTSISVDGMVAGETAMEVLLKKWRGEETDHTTYIGLKPVYRASCGCHTGYDEDFFNNAFIKKQQFQEAMNLTTYMFVGFDDCHTFQEIIHSAQASLKSLDFSKAYVCLCDESERMEEKKNQFTENMILKAIFTPDDVEFCEDRFKRTDILPQEYREKLDVMVISTLHEKSDCLGYVVIQFNSTNMMDCIYHNWLVGFSNALGRMKMYEENQLLEEIRIQYVTDTLTGIPNRRGFEKKMQLRVEKLYNTGKGFCFFSLDMDGLKYINDTFGHSVGDEALQEFAKILQKLVVGIGECARIGGDEFWACISTEESGDAEAFYNKLQEKMDEWNEKNKKIYRLSASAGYAFCNRKQNLTSCMENADQNMYIDKAKRKRNRNN